MRPPMFFVYAFNRGTDDYEVVGAYSVKDEAERFAESIKDWSPSIAVVQKSFEEMLDEQVRYRLGDLAALIDRRFPETLPVAPVYIETPESAVV